MLLSPPFEPHKCRCFTQTRASKTQATSAPAASFPNPPPLRGFRPHLSRRMYSSSGRLGLMRMVSTIFTKATEPSACPGDSGAAGESGGRRGGMHGRQCGNGKRTSNADRKHTAARHHRTVFLLCQLISTTSRMSTSLGPAPVMMVVSLRITWTASREVMAAATPCEGREEDGNDRPCSRSRTLSSRTTMGRLDAGLRAYSLLLLLSD